jgi:molecular chaperone DnaJ
MSKRDYYEVLGVAKGASADEIKKAFRRGAVQHHPDKEGGDEAKFKEINEAYEVLSNSEKRQRYDQFGHAGVGSSAASDGGSPFGGFGGQGGHFDFGDMGFGDILGDLFGGGRSRGGNRQARGRDVETTLDLSFEEAVFGTEAEVDLNINDTCEHCKGTMAEPGHDLKTCDTCKGSGQQVRVMQTVFGNIQQASVCGGCQGRGKIPEMVCTVCKGAGVQRKNNQVKMKIPAGIDDGVTIRLREHGEAIGGGAKGDLYVNIRVRPHKEFTREGDLILGKAIIGMVDAALGCEIDIVTVDGPVRMKVPAGTQSGTDFKLSGHGIPHPRGDSRGAHIVTVIVQTPTNLSKDHKILLEQLKNIPSKKSLFGF